jgi:dGTPase
MIGSRQRDRRFRKEKLSGRTHAQIDRDRVLYCPHLARLADVTQVRTLDGEHLVHNRLTHSLKVGQLARRITEKLLNDESKDQRELANLWLLNPDVAEAAGLAHDLGHPPFGHIAEHELNDLVGEAMAEGYEGNAQGFRIVTRLGVSDVWPARLEFGPVAKQGLNLTRATLNAILKYPWLYLENEHYKDKWGAYKTEADLFAWTRRDLTEKCRSPEAEIMDWADDITYAIHDLIDFYCAGLIPLHVLTLDPSGTEWSKFFSRAKERKAKFQNSVYEEELMKIIPLFPDEAYDGSQEHTWQLWRLATFLITKFVAAIKLAEPARNDGRYTKVDERAGYLAAILQELTWVYVIQSADLAVVQHGQKRMIRRLFEALLEKAAVGNWKLFPTGFAKFVSVQPDTPPARLVADYISGLTERQIVRLDRKLVGGA